MTAQAAPRAPCPAVSSGRRKAGHGTVQIPGRAMMNVGAAMGPCGSMLAHAGKSSPRRHVVSHPERSEGTLRAPTITNRRISITEWLQNETMGLTLRPSKLVAIPRFASGLNPTHFNCGTSSSALSSRCLNFKCWASQRSRSSKAALFSAWPAS
jgi:hypothetical protein